MIRVIAASFQAVSAYGKTNSIEKSTRANRPVIPLNGGIIQLIRIACQRTSIRSIFGRVKCYSGFPLMERRFY
jgi:hypothetical protein